MGHSNPLPSKDQEAMINKDAMRRGKAELAYRLMDVIPRSGWGMNRPDRHAD